MSNVIIGIAVGVVIAYCWGGYVRWHITRNPKQSDFWLWWR